MILCAEGVGQKLKWNEFVAVTMAGLASNVPEVIMIGFGVKAEPRVAFVVTCLTLRVTHVFACTVSWGRATHGEREWCLAPGVACKMHEGGTRDG